MGEQSGNLEDKLKNINYHKPLRCEFCGAGLRYTGVGEYKCNRCRQIMLDDYGKVRKYVQEKGSANAAEISRDTGVDKDVIDEMIKQGALESSVDAVGKLKCASCGKPISKGRFCNDCIWKIASGLNDSFAAAKKEKQESPAKKAKGPGKMYTFDDDK